jgi:hypothetical protein
MEVLIVAKTLMRNAYCVGSYNLTNQKNLRLLLADEGNQPLDTKFDIGQIWDIEYIERSHIIKPHIEDVLIQKATFLRNIDNIYEFLIQNVNIWRGSPNVLFNGKINFPIGKSGFLERKKSDLAQSVGFWMPDEDVELTILNDKKHYLYFGQQVYSFPFVGSINKIETIPKCSILRISLTRWWSPNPSNIEKRCYCQLSGWYEKPKSETKNNNDDLPF